MALVRNFATVGGATLASRILGFVRDALIAASLGAGALSDAFVIAFRLPNLFRRLFGEGAFNSAFVPLYARKLESDGEPGARAFAAEAFSGLALVLVLFSALAMLAAPVLVVALASGFTDEPDKFDLTVTLTRICFPYLACVSLTAMLGGVLNAHRDFFLAAAAPVLLNVVMVAVLVGVLLAGAAGTRSAAIALSWGVFAAGLAQLAVLAWGVARSPARFRLGRPRLSPEMGRLLKLGIPGALAGGVTQINILIDSNIASWQEKAASYLYYADRVYQLPLGIVGVAIGVVLLPEIARSLQAGRADLVFHAQNRSLEFAALLTIPAAVALGILAQPIVSVLFERGAFRAADALATADALTAFAFGLPAFVFAKVFAPGFFAREDTRTPMIYALIAMVVNGVGGVTLFFALPGQAQLAVSLATATAGWINCALLFGTLRRRGLWHSDAQIRKALPRICGAAAAMGAALLVGGQALAPWLGPGKPLLPQTAALALLCTLGAAIFFALAHVTGGFPLQRLKSSFRRRRTPAPAASEG